MLKISTLLIILFTTLSFSTTINVSTTGSDETGDGSENNPYATIQKGVDVSVDGDTVLVESGTYSEEVQILDKFLTLASHLINHPDSLDLIHNTVIDGPDLEDGRILRAHNNGNEGETLYDTTFVIGLSLTGGGSTSGDAVYWTSNTGTQDGEAWWHGTMNIKHCNIFQTNNPYSGIETHGDLSLENVTIGYESSGVVSYGNHAGLRVKNSIILNGFSIINTEPTWNITYTLFNGFAYDEDASNIQGGWDGEPYISPFFCNPSNDDYSLAENSPAVGSGELNTNMGAFDVGCESVYSSTIYVSTAGSDETGDGSEENPFASIQKGVDTSVNGDSVLVDSGTYFENIQITDKMITLSSHLALYPDSLDLINNTIIDGGGVGTVLSVLHNQSGAIGETYPDTIKIFGFSLINGSSNNEQYGNAVAWNAPNGTSNGSVWWHSTLSVENCNISQNTSGGFSDIGTQGNLYLNKVTISNSNDVVNGVVGWDSTGIHVKNSIIRDGFSWYNREPIWNITYTLCNGSVCNEDESNIHGDPLFCDPESGDYSLAENSPAVGSGENGINMGALGIGCEAIDLSLSDKSQLPMEYALHQNYPNPFNPVTIIQYDLPENGFVNIIVYDMLGNMVNNLVSKVQNSGSKSIQWNATNNQGQPVSAGVYFYNIEVGDFRQSKKMILLK